MTPEHYLDDALNDLNMQRVGVMYNFPLLRELIKIWGEDKTYSLKSYEVEVYFYNVLDPRDLIKEIHHKMRKAGFEALSLNKENLMWAWRKNNTAVYTRIHLSKESTCRKVQVGTSPKYEIVCDDNPIEVPT